MVEYGEVKKPSQGPSFAAVVRQRDLKDALLAVAADDSLDGLLIRGEKGTAKSTAVRALAECLPTQRAVADCPYGCPPDDPGRQCSDCRSRERLPAEERSAPLVTLPLGATRDRVVGTLSVADALAGDHEFDPGLLARANRGILYVDEVNLLEDHLVDVLLDAAASGINRVERDGVTVTHPATFTLVGTMNPEEGDLRPQLRDRFALQTTVTACEDVDDRVAIIDGALGDGNGTEGRSNERPAGERLRAARDRLDEVDLAREFREQIARLCLDAGLDGHRGDIATARTARVFAALDGRTTVLEPDVERAAEFALPHRLASTPFEDSPNLDDVLADHFGDESGGGDADSDERSERTESDDDPDAASPDGATDDSAGGADDQTAETGPGPGGDDGDQEPPEADGPGCDAPDDSDGDSPSPAEAGADTADNESDAQARDGDEETDGDDATPLLPGQSSVAVGDSTAPEVGAPAVDTDSDAASGRAEATGTARGATVRTQRAGPGDEVDAAASVRAAARRGRGRVDARDLRQSVRVSDAETLVVFALDASASMRPAMRAAKGTVLELLEDAYQARDEVSVVTFAGEDADVVLPPTDSVSRAARHLKDLPTGDRTPLPAGLAAAHDVLARTDPDAGIAVVVTDGRANTASGSPVAATREAARRLGSVADRTVVVDAGAGTRAGLVGVVADETAATVVSLDALTAERIDTLAGE
ncbi:MULTISPECIES: VWA domain-containing protein [Haloarcula]|uniref:VWA domain-containing protein n=1 Tax=Haloarcula TaxID=2237 RepID=UPI0023EBF150|nr:VWA domain-containing protein [Halomicroarcula sp. XH51]